jgi:hypothetical protein
VLEISISDIDLIEQKQIGDYGSVLKYMLRNNPDTKYDRDTEFIGVIIDG